MGNHHKKTPKPTIKASAPPFIAKNKTALD